MVIDKSIEGLFFLVKGFSGALTGALLKKLDKRATPTYVYAIR
jgi:hypothetical protein